MAVEYQGQIRVIGAPSWGSMFTWQAGLSFALNAAGLAPGNYEIQVQARDTVAGSISNWSAARQFVVSHGVLYDGEYRKVGDATWISLFSNQSGLSFPWNTGALANTDYDLRVRAHDILGGAQSLWSATRTFTVFHPPTGGGGGPDQVTLTDNASIAKFGRRFMQLVEDASSNIDTQTEAVDLAQAALDDLSLPTADQEIETLLFWPVQYGDRYTFQANSIHYDEDQDHYITGIRHRISAVGIGRTTIQSRSKPSGSHLDWLRREASPGGGPVNDPNAGTGPNLSVTPVPTPDYYDIVWTASGTIQVFKDSILIATPPNSFRVLRSNVFQTYEFQATLNNQLVGDSLVIPPYGVDIVTPDLIVLPGSMTSTTETFAVSAVNPQAAHLGFITPAMIPQVTMLLTGCTAAGFSGPGPHALNYLGQNVVINRPAFASGPASVTFRADIVGGGFEKSVYTIPNQDKLVFGPIYSVIATPNPNGLTVSLAWSVTVPTTMQLYIDGVLQGSVPATPIVVARDAIGGVDKVYTFVATADGQSIPTSITIGPRQGSGTAPPSIDAITFSGTGIGASTLQVGWLASNAPAGATFQGYWEDSGDILGGPVTSGAITSPWTTHGVAFVAKGTSGAIPTTVTFEIRMKTSGGVIIATKSAQRSGYAIP